jgi:uncharacterized membrane protein (DUF2068 family)
MRRFDGTTMKTRQGRSPQPGSGQADERSAAQDNTPQAVLALGREQLDCFTGLRLIAAFEAFKGLLVLTVGLALLRYINSDLESFCEDVVRHLHLNPARGLARMFLASAGRVPDDQMGLLVTLSVLYATIRFVEAFGLWHERAWAEWFAFISCALYLPIELYEVSRGVSPLKVALVLVNALVVGYLWLALRGGAGYRIIGAKSRSASRL